MCPVMFGPSFDDVTGQALGINFSRDMGDTLGFMLSRLQS